MKREKRPVERVSRSRVVGGCCGANWRETLMGVARSRGARNKQKHKKEHNNGRVALHGLEACAQIARNMRWHIFVTTDERAQDGSAPVLV